MSLYPEPDSDPSDSSSDASSADGGDLYGLAGATSDSDDSSSVWSLKDLPRLSAQGSARNGGSRGGSGGGGSGDGDGGDVQGPPVSGDEAGDDMFPPTPEGRVRTRRGFHRTRCRKRLLPLDRKAAWNGEGSGHEENTVVHMLAICSRDTNACLSPFFLHGSVVPTVLNLCENGQQLLHSLPRPLASTLLRVTVRASHGFLVLYSYTCMLHTTYKLPPSGPPRLSVLSPTEPLVRDAVRDIQSFLRYVRRLSMTPTAGLFSQRRDRQGGDISCLFSIEETNRFARRACVRGASKKKAEKKVRKQKRVTTQEIESGFHRRGINRDHRYATRQG